MNNFEGKSPRPDEVSKSSPEPEESLQEGEEQAPPGTHAMAIVRWGLVALMGIAALLSILYFLGVFQHSTTTHAATQYYCPMHPSVVQDRPGQCPICSMDLVPKPASGSGAESPRPQAMSDEAVPGLVPIDLGPERIQLMGMRTAPVTREALVPEIRTVGFVSADESRLAKVETRFAGWIEQLLVSETGQRVDRGQVLARVYSPELLAAQQEFLNARAWAQAPGSDSSGSSAMNRGLEEDARRRLELLGVSRPEIADLERTGHPVRALALRSPVRGHVVVKNAVQGSYVQPGSQLFEVADLSSIWVLADVYESEIARVHSGQQARLELTAFPEQSFIGRLHFIYPTVDPATRTLRVRMQFPNPDLRLRPGMYGDVVIELDPASGLVVPSESIVDTGELQYVFLARSGGRFEPRRVRVGVRSGMKVQLLQGVDEGDTVVTSANFLIDSESRLRAAIEGTFATGGTAKSGPGQGPNCDTEFDKNKYPDKYRQCKQCELVHRGMGTMEEDCKSAIPKPWK